ncbi:MAG: redoxin domain-containing protein [Gammaproteobacteria bacterium]|nr:redoxin domain-containing protein [Gammaproteobacteria bacterium]
MYYVKLFRRYFVVVLLCAGLGACADLTDDLDPSGTDNREAVVPGTTGSMPGQIAADFTISDSLGNKFRLSDHLAGGSDPTDVVMLYFTMWCPICLSHSDHIFNSVIPGFAGRGRVIYGLVDYVSGSVAATRATEIANGYAGSDFTTLTDVNQDLLDQFNASMGTVVLIDSDGTVLLNEDYRNGRALIGMLEQELP